MEPERFLEKPSLFIKGIVRTPVDATFATALPEIIPMKALPITATSPAPPWMRPPRRSATLMKVRPAPLGVQELAEHQEQRDHAGRYPDQHGGHALRSEIEAEEQPIHAQPAMPQCAGNDVAPDSVGDEKANQRHECQAKRAAYAFHERGKEDGREELLWQGVAEPVCHDYALALDDQVGHRDQGGGREASVDYAPAARQRTGCQRQKYRAADMDAAQGVAADKTRRRD